MSALRLAVVLGLAVAAAVVANVALLSLSGGRHEEVGKLTPVASIRPSSENPTTTESPMPESTTEPVTTMPTQTQPPRTTPATTEQHHDGGEDD
jgi:hypothetical protein